MFKLFRRALVIATFAYFAVVLPLVGLILPALPDEAAQLRLCKFLAVAFAFNAFLALIGLSRGLDTRPISAFTRGRDLISSSLAIGFNSAFTVVHFSSAKLEGFLHDEKVIVAWAIVQTLCMIGLFTTIRAANREPATV